MGCAEWIRRRTRLSFPAFSLTFFVVSLNPWGPSLQSWSTTGSKKAEQRQLTLPPPRPTEDGCSRSHDGEIVSLCEWNIRGTWKIFDETKTARFMLTFDLVRKSLALGYFTLLALFATRTFFTATNFVYPAPSRKKRENFSTFRPDSWNYSVLYNRQRTIQFIRYRNCPIWRTL